MLPMPSALLPRQQVGGPSGVGTRRCADLDRRSKRADGEAGVGQLVDSGLGLTEAVSGLPSRRIRPVAVAVDGNEMVVSRRLLLE
jgi:hypothetical protein